LIVSNQHFVQYRFACGAQSLEPDQLKQVVSVLLASGLGARIPAQHEKHPKQFDAVPDWLKQ
jgi:hypothetical protein